MSSLKLPSAHRMPLEDSTAKQLNTGADIGTSESPSPELEVGDMAELPAQEELLALNNMSSFQFSFDPSPH